MLSPSELESKKIEARGRKYFKLEMDEYLNLIFENYRALYAENEELKKQIKTLSDGIQYYRSIESTMQKALVLAEKTSKETKDAAVLKAEAIEKEARNKANKIVSEAENEYDRIRDKCLDLVAQFNRYKSQLQSAAHEQLRLVTSASFEVDTPDIEGRDVQAALQTPVSASDMPGVSELTPSQREDVPQVQPEPSPLDIGAAPGYAYEEENIQPAPTEESLGTEWTASEAPVPEIPVPEKTTVLPDVKSYDKEALRSNEPMTDEQVDSILTAKTINISDSIQAVRQMEGEELTVSGVSAAPEQLDVEMAEQPVAPELILEPESSAPANTGLDTILENMTIGKKKTGEAGTDDDPFEFLGSVDDF